MFRRTLLLRKVKTNRRKRKNSTSSVGRTGTFKIRFDSVVEKREIKAGKVTQNSKDSTDSKKPKNSIFQNIKKKNKVKKMERLGSLPKFILDGRIEVGDIMCFTEEERPESMALDEINEIEGQSLTLRNIKFCANSGEEPNHVRSLRHRERNKVKLLNDSYVCEEDEDDEVGSSVVLNLDDDRGPAVSLDSTFSEEKTPQPTKPIKEKWKKRGRVDTSKVILFDLSSLNI